MKEELAASSAAGNDKDDEEKTPELNRVSGIAEKRLSVVLFMFYFLQKTPETQHKVRRFQWKRGLLIYYFLFSVEIT